MLLRLLGYTSHTYLFKTWPTDCFSVVTLGTGARTGICMHSRGIQVNREGMWSSHTYWIQLGYSYGKVMRLDLQTLLMAKEWEELEQATMPVKLALVKVCALLVLSYLHMLTSPGPALPTCIQGQMLLHHPSSRVENHSWGAQAVHHAHSVGHRNPVEFDIWHAGVHPATL